MGKGGRRERGENAARGSRSVAFLRAAVLACARDGQGKAIGQSRRHAVDSFFIQSHSLCSVLLLDGAGWLAGWNVLLLAGRITTSTDMDSSRHGHSINACHPHGPKMSGI